MTAIAVIGEDGSRDSSRSILLSARPLVRTVDTSELASIPSRLRRMAHGREVLLKRIPKTRMVAVIDFDEPFLSSVNATVLSAAINRLESDNSIYGIAATSAPTYYDLLAYEDEGRSFADLEQRISQNRRDPLTYYRFFRDVVYPAQRQLTSSMELRCRSAFNGLAIYPSAAYMRGSYLEHDSHELICEHVVFNRRLQLVLGGEMLISPALRLPTPREHGPRRLPGFAVQRIAKAARLPRVKHWAET
jgi:hypothetical protein